MGPVLDDRANVDREPPGASASSRRDPPEGFALVTRPGRRDALPGRFHGHGIGTQPHRGHPRRSRRPSDSVAGLLDLPELAALIDGRPCLLSNNTGPVHIAAAVGTPVVDLYCPHQPPAHALGRAASRALSRCALQSLLQEHLPRRASRLLALGEGPGWSAAAGELLAISRSRPPGGRTSSTCTHSGLMWRS